MSNPVCHRHGVASRIFDCLTWGVQHLSNTKIRGIFRTPTVYDRAEQHRAWILAWGTRDAMEDRGGVEDVDWVLAVVWEHRGIEKVGGMRTMKKRMLALVLALTIVAGLGGRTWAEGLPGVESPSPEVTDQAQASEMPAQSEPPEESQAPTGSASAEESAAPEESAFPEQSPAPTEEKTDATPAETPVQDESYALSGAENYASTYQQVQGLEDVVGTTVDVFDYWLSSQQSSDQSNPDAFWNSGINAGHVLMFGVGLGGTQNIASAEGDTASGGLEFHNNYNWNGWSGRGSGPVNGIVGRVLGADGYPVLDLEGWAKASNLAGRSRTESLAYLFSPDVAHSGKQSYTNVGGLLRVNQQGYYYYDSNGAFASLYDGMSAEEFKNGADGANFKLYTSSRGYANTTGGVSAAGNSPNGQFFPFDTAGEVFGGSPITSTHASLNHYFGVHMQSRFVQQYGGRTEEDGDIVTYEFSGDDDVWIFIDGVLVADLGGIHDAVSVEIDFSTGVVSISSASTYKEHNQSVTFGRYTTTLKKQFYAAGKDVSKFVGETFADRTYHTLDFFYLERGNTDSNMNLKYNLVSVPESSIVKVDQTGDPVEGAEFGLYLANRGYTQLGDLVATGSTDERGQFVLLNDQGFLVSLQELWANMEASGYTYPDGGMTRGNLVLRETQKPEGYRSAGDVHLYLVQSGENIVMLSDNHWDVGAYAYANSTISMDGKVTYYNGKRVVSADLDRGGTLFAVVLRRTSGVGQKPTERDTWKLVTGSPTEGWDTSTEVAAGTAGIKAVLEKLRTNPGNGFTAQLDASGAYQTTVSDLPGDVMTYYYMLDEASKAQTEYMVSFFYTTARSVDGANTSNTYRVTNSDGWDRSFSSNVYVPNIKNRIFVQKLAPDGTSLEGAKFQLYYDAKCSKPVAYGEVTTRNLNKAQDGIDLPGAGMYPTGNRVLPNGTYYLKELEAPDGYVVHDKVTKIVVDDTGVYADAGEADDGIVVARGVGSIVKSMAQFAPLGDIDATLNNIVAKFYTVPSSYISGTTTDFSSLTWRSQSNGEFVPNTSAGVSYHPSYWGVGGTDGSQDRFWLYDTYTPDDAPDGAQPLGMHMVYSPDARLEYDPGVVLEDGQTALSWMTTDTGWSKLMMEQCLAHSSQLEDQGYKITDLTNPLLDLTNLFSGTVIVQVTDRHTTSLTITKEVTDAVAGNVSDKTYSFAVEKLNADGNAVDTAYEGTVQVKVGGGKETTQQFQNGALTVSCTGTGEIEIVNLANGTYTVTEHTSEMGQVVVNGETYVWQNETYTAGSDNVQTTDGGATAVIHWDAEDTANASVTVTNHYAAQQLLTVTKTVDGNMGDTTKDFTFTMTVSKGGVSYGESLDAVKTGGALTAPDATALTSTENAYTFTLAHDQEIAIPIPYGYTVTVTETAVEGYSTTSRQYESAVPSTSDVLDGGAVQSVTMTQDYTVDYRNTWRQAPPSGVSTPHTGIWVMVGVAAASAVVIFGCSFLTWRRRHRDRM